MYKYTDPTDRNKYILNYVGTGQNLISKKEDFNHPYKNDFIIKEYLKIIKENKDIFPEDMRKIAYDKYIYDNCTGEMFEYHISDFCSFEKIILYIKHVDTYRLINRIRENDLKLDQQTRLDYTEKQLEFRDDFIRLSKLINEEKEI